MDEQFAALGLGVERLQATTPETINDDEIAPYRMTEVVELLSPTEIAISISHFRVWKHMLDRGHRQVLVLEDDVGLSRLLPSFLAALEKQDPDFGILRLETHLAEVLLHPRPEPGPTGFSFHLPLSFEPGAGAYIISAAAAGRILASPKRFSLPLDDILFSLESPFRDSSRLRVAVPALAIYRFEDSPEFRVPASILQSDAQPDRELREARALSRKLTELQKIGREIRRLGRQIRGALPAIWTYLFARRAIVPFADGAFSARPSAALPRA
jgi:GR25 family glycosyltransferase involved in LPS biosynthesis